MKKQKAPFFTAYLLRSAVSLLLVLGICLLPLVFPQQVITERAALQLAPSPTPTVPNGGCGRAWRVVATPNVGGNTNILFGINPSVGRRDLLRRELCGANLD
jgi:hypothetical protein